jgi:hypothetical protein
MGANRPIQHTRKRYYNSSHDNLSKEFELCKVKKKKRQLDNLNNT